MAKKINYSERIHSWEGTAIIREDGQLKDKHIGVVHTEKKLKETGVKELFKELNLIPENAITIEVAKMVDVVTTYTLDVEKFKEMATVVEAQEELPEELEEGQDPNIEVL